MEKKVLLFAYSRANFGDDLFIYILANKYKNVEFYIHIKDEKYKKPFTHLKNVNFLDTERDVHNINIDEFDGYMYVGGSIFIESEYSRHEVKEFNYFIKECNKNNKPFFYITCNFGPYQSQEYLDLVKENFSLCKGVCVRDKASYEFFKEIPTVSYAPDMAFTYSLEHIKEKRQRCHVGISVINLEIRENLKEKNDIYNDYIKRIIVKFAKRGYKVSLISFCEFEEDKKAIDKIKAMVPEQYLSNVNELLYKGNIEEFIKEYSKINYMVCTRFHSMILSIILKQKIYNLFYSKKQKNASDDFELFKNMVDIKDLTFETRLRKSEFKKVTNKKHEQLLEKSTAQLEKFEQWQKS